ncbi:piggyBac transposable element-derived protein 4-like, partial [Aphis craccivora]
MVSVDMTDMLLSSVLVCNVKISTNNSFKIPEAKSGGLTRRRCKLSKINNKPTGTRYTCKECDV